MLQKMINSPVEKENTTMCMDTMVSKSILSPSQSSPTFFVHSLNTRGRHPLADHDLNSRDTGSFKVLSEDSRSLTRFEPRTVIEKKNSSLNVSRSESIDCYKGIPEIDDQFPEKVNSPSILSQDSLHNGDIFASHLPIIKPIVRRRNSKYDSDTPRKVDLVFGEINNTDGVVKKRKLFNEFECPSEKSIVSKVLKPKVDISMSFDSPTLDTGNTSLIAPVSHKKTTFFDYGFCKNSVSKLQSSFSTNEATIKAAFEKKDKESNLIGDFSQSFILPLLSLGRHADLHSISPDTLAHLLEGTFNGCIDSYLIIDCRYPYEYEGGHIRGAINIFTKEQLIKDYTEDKLGKKSNKTDKINVKRNVLIFHCEFSSERGPSLSRYLRNADRENNSMCYPYLDYPEMYLLDGGYCKFYSQHSRLCVPSSYRSMFDPAHTSELRKFRSKSKTRACHNEATPRLAGKNTLRRLAFN
ncbi:M-phase inducer phosphatase 3-like [Metopolophium dirhodum]|uniref:M-phase inducer phosphatase 3-like n=1 Tax=Metopolophium dirhodum TaxID=44670 RepID=UPI0029901F08|nr:M-phase inducer phosphatase 3-like [Metopolophium dirhodum]